MRSRSEAAPPAGPAARARNPRRRDGRRPPSQFLPVLSHRPPRRWCTADVDSEDADATSVHVSHRRGICPAAPAGGAQRNPMGKCWRASASASSSCSCFVSDDESSSSAASAADLGSPAASSTSAAISGAGSGLQRKQRDGQRCCSAKFNTAGPSAVGHAGATGGEPCARPCARTQLWINGEKRGHPIDVVTFLLTVDCAFCRVASGALLRGQASTRGT